MGFCLAARAFPSDPPSAREGARSRTELRVTDAAIVLHLHARVRAATDLPDRRRTSRGASLRHPRERRVFSGDRRSRPAVLLRSSRSRERRDDGARRSASSRPISGRSTARRSRGSPWRCRATSRRSGNVSRRSESPATKRDIRFAYSYLRDRDLRGTIAIEGPWQPEGRLRRVYRNPELTPADYFPTLRVLSLDIETDPKARNAFAIGLAGLGADRVLIVGPGPLRGAECFPDERALLQPLLRPARRVRSRHPDRLERRRFRPHGPAATLSSPRDPLPARPHRRGDDHPARPGLHPRRPRLRARPHGPRRPRRSSGAPSSASTTTSSRPRRRPSSARASS